MPTRSSSRCGNRPLIEYPLRVFDSHQAIALIVVVVSKSGRERLESCVRGFGLETEIRFTLGGVRRQDSVEAGMRAAPDADWLVIHDAARPFIDEAMIDRGLKAAEITGAAVAGIRCRDTVKLVDSERTIRETVDRDSLWMIQTPPDLPAGAAGAGIRNGIRGRHRRGRAVGGPRPGGEGVRRARLGT